MVSTSTAAQPTRLEQFDEQGITPFHLKVLLVSGMGFFTDAYDLFIISVVIRMLRDQWQLSALQTSLVDSAATLAAVIGAIVFGRIADMLGRRRIYGVEVLVLAVGAIASALSPSLGWLIFFRFILGLGIGGDYPVSATIMSEYAGRKTRGALVSLVFAMQAAGLIVGPLLALAFLSTTLPQDVIWRILLALGAIPGLAVFFLRRQIQETPRFQAAHPETPEGEQSSAPQSEAVVSGFQRLAENRRVLTWLVGAAGAWFLLDYAYYGNTVSSQLILSALDPQKDVRTDTLLQLLIFVVAALPGYAVAALTLDRLGRKPVQFLGFALMAVAFGSIALVPGVADAVVPFMVAYGVGYFFTEFGPNTTTFVYPAEIFPVDVRTTAHGLAAAAGKLGAFLGTFALPILLDKFHIQGAQLSVAAVCAGGFLLTFLLPESKGKTLEDMTREAGWDDALRTST
ncbi:MAG: MFS transporter [Chloroflexi bacterium]|nr:MFS transporter [Chloroflexota bacterium]